MEDVKQFLNTWCAKHKLKQTYENVQSGEKHRPMFSCEVRVEGIDYVGVGSGASKKDAQTLCARDMVRQLVQLDYVQQSEVPSVMSNLDGISGKEGTHQNVGGAAELSGVAAPSQILGQGKGILRRGYPRSKEGRKFQFSSRSHTRHFEGNRTAQNKTPSDEQPFPVQVVTDRQVDITARDAGFQKTADDVKVTEETVEHNFKIFRPYLEQNIKPLDLIVYYDYFSIDDRKKLNAALSANSMEVTELAFSTIERMRHPDKFMHLLHALEAYPKLVLVLKGLLVPINDAHRQSINLAARHIYEKLSPSDLIPCLITKGVIHHIDAETIRTIADSKGRGSAAVELMFILPNRSPNWYRLFIEALIEHDDSAVLPYLIDPDLAKQIKAGGHVSLPPMAESLQPRNMVEREQAQVDEAFGNPVSVNNLDAPNMREKSLELDSLKEVVPQLNSGEFERNSLGGEGDKKLRQATEPNYQTPLRTELKDILKMNELQYDDQNSVSLNSAETSRSHEGNFGVPDGVSITNPKVLYERDPPEGSDFRSGYNENKMPFLCKNMKDKDKTMKDKDLSSADEEKPDNTRAKIRDDGSFMDPGEKEDIPDKDISLREYQKELAEPALRGENVLIVAPTGSGKTRVALKIIQEHMRRTKGRSIAKVIFLVNQVALANQQAEACQLHLKKYTTKVISGDTQRSRGECLKDFVDKRDIMVVTVQVLLDALVKKEIDSITKFSLMIFDECHHTHTNHPFNQIMSMYIDLKLDDKTDPTSLPQIVGLTASVGVGKAKDENGAVKHIKSLMANLDSKVICTVQNNMAELRRFVNIPDEETCTVPKRCNDVFGQGVTCCMERIEKNMTTSPLVTKLPEAEQFEKTLRAPAEKGTAQYTQWLSTLWKETAKLRNQEARRFLNPCRAHLEYYNNALIIYNDARVVDAVSYLKENMKRWKENAIMNDNERMLESFYKGTLALPFHQDTVNPKLEKLREIILRAYKGQEQSRNSRGIVFVKTRDLATAIVSWMKETPGLKDLNAIKFVGQNESADKGGMTKAEQDDALKYFKDGKHKLIVATSVAEEGLDISKCNLVIRYDHVTNEIAMVQSRGRGRAEDSKYKVVAEEGRGMAEKEELNMIREILMRKAIVSLQKHIFSSPGGFIDELLKLQEDAKLDRDLQAVGRKGKRIRRGEFELRCQRCSDFICMSSDVKKIQNAHHVCVDESLKDRVDYVRGTSKYIDDSITSTGKLICMECGFELGGIIIHKSLEFPVLKIEKYLIVDMNERQDTCKQWKKAPFDPQPLTTADFRAILQKRKETGKI